MLALLPADASRRDVSLVSVSTTLATNAVVENRFSPVCTLLIGFDDAMVERSGLQRPGGGGLVARIQGGHGATGEEASALDEAAVARAVAAHEARVEAFAVAANFSVRNPAHELRARKLIRELTPKPVTCAHELSSKLDAPRRALTAALNARLTPQIRHLIEALSRVVADESIDAPLMIVKGDGSLMKAQIALEYPVETILSGPAASVVGAGFLTGLTDFVVADMGGTTTDIAVVAGGRPVISGEGALVGAWRTMVEAVDVRTSGLGGDSEVHLDRQHRLCVGPRKAMPLSLLAHTHPAALARLKSIAELERLPAYPAQFAFRNPGRSLPAHVSPLERRVWDAMEVQPRPVAELVRSGAGLEALRRLADAGLATVAAFTPSDAMHVLGRQHGWCREAAEYGARILATEERNARAARAADSPQAICERTLRARRARHGPRPACRGARARSRTRGARTRLGRARRSPHRGHGRRTAVLEAAARDARPRAAVDRDRRAGWRLLPRSRAAAGRSAVHSRARSGLQRRGRRRRRGLADGGNSGESADVQRLSRPRSRRAAGIIRRRSLRSSTPSAQRASSRWRRRGAPERRIRMCETSVTEKRAHVGPGADYLAEAVARSTATGRPLAGHLAGRGSEPRDIA